MSTPEETSLIMLDTPDTVSPVLIEDPATVSILAEEAGGAGSYTNDGFSEVLRKKKRKNKKQGKGDENHMESKQVGNVSQPSELTSPVVSGYNCMVTHA